ncbi:MAG: hypothetical protein HY429_00480 [Candidatus Levybacteria bacterium]|nr:hypothetical protein [Candidatus Levybacteria bacterium]
MDTAQNLSPVATQLVKSFIQKVSENGDKKISVNPFVAHFASWYEKLRNAMEYREEEVILRATIERILKRRLLLGGHGKTVAQPLLRELVWARYFPNESLSESLIDVVAKKIDLYLQLREQILAQKKFSENVLNEWTYHLMSSDIARTLHPNKEKEAMVNFFYQLVYDDVTIVDDTTQTRDAQVYLAIRKSFAKDDIAFLRYNLFYQIFGQLTDASVERIANTFPKGYEEIDRQLHHRAKDKIFSYVKRRAAIFLILEDMLRLQKEHFPTLIKDEEKLKQEVFDACEVRYADVTSKVRRAIIRSVVFILLTKVIFAFAIEGTFEKFVYGNIMWNALVINTAIPPLLMIVVGLFVRVPRKENSERIFTYIKAALFEENPTLGNALSLTRDERLRNPFLQGIFSVLWVLAFVVSFGGLIYVLTRLNFTVVSQIVFIFFLAIVSFLAYRISLIPRAYMVGDKQGLVTPLVDFLFMPVIRVGRHLTEGIAQINVIIFIFDFIIETPFKGIFAFFEQWFFFLHAKREELE